MSFIYRDAVSVLMAQGGGTPRDAAATATSPDTYPHIGTLLVGAGIGLTTFAGSSGSALPDSARAIIGGLGAAASAVGLFLLGRASI